MEQLEEKIGKDIDLQQISQLLCKKYQLGKYQSYYLISTGIEDFNYCLVLEDKKYFIKLFNIERKKEEIIMYVKKYKLLQAMKISCPKILNIDKEGLICLKIEKRNVYLVIMEHVEGEDLYSSQECITQQQVINLTKMIEKVHQILSRTKCIYDDYHINHFNETYDMCISYMDEEWKIIGKDLKREYNKIDFSKMSKKFIHGDLHKGNILKDKKGKLYLIDFSSCGYSYRIVDIVKFINDTLFNYKEIEMSRQRIKCFLQHYKLEEYEIKHIDILSKCYAFMCIELKQYDFCYGKNQRDENTYWTKNNIAIIQNEKSII